MPHKNAINGYILSNIQQSKYFILFQMMVGGGGGDDAI
jgi:hypothetical protein